MKITIRLAITLAIIGGVLFLGSIILFFWGDFPAFNNLIDTEKLGHMGGLISGLIGSIWALTGVILFYVALTTQREDFKTNIKALKTQIKEFELQRVELAETRKVFKEQSETMQQQRFENTFFNMLTTFNSIKKDDKTFRALFIDELRKVDYRNESLSEVLLRFYDFYSIYENFFQFSEMILQVIVNSDIRDKKYYGQIFHSFLTKIEKMTLFYYGLSNRGHNLKSYIEDLNFFVKDFDIQIVPAHRTHYKNHPIKEAMNALKKK